MPVARQPKPRTCACGCGARFVPSMTTQKAHTWECALKLARAKREKEEARERRRQEQEERKAWAARKLATKKLAWWLAKAQKAFNAYIRERDKAEPCISCGKWDDDQWQAGHFLSVGSHPELRFNEDNVHKQCGMYCNHAKSGNIAEYRPRLIAKIGQKRVDVLEGPHEPAKYTREDCQRIESEYKAKLKELRKNVP